MRFTRFAFALSLAAVAFAPPSRAEEPVQPLQKANQLEVEGRRLIEQGHRAEGANTISKAWRIRAEVWGAEREREKKEGEKREARPEIAALKERIEQLRAASNDAERQGHELAGAGKVEDAKEKMEESGRLWREAKAIEEKCAQAERIAREAHALKEVAEGKAWPSEKFAAEKVVPSRAAEFQSAAARAREEVAGAAADAERLRAQGKEEAAKAAVERMERLKHRVSELEAAIKDLYADRRAEPSPKQGLESEVKALKAQVEEMRRILEEVRKRLDDKDK